MTIQFRVEWNGYDAGGVYALPAPEETRLIAADLAFAYTGPLTSPGVVTVGDDGILRDPKGQPITSGVSSTDSVARTAAATAQSTADGKMSQTQADARYVRTVNGTAPDGSGNVVVAGGGGGSALPTAIAPVTAIPLDGNKVFNADTVMSATALTIAAGQVEGGSCSFVIKGDGSSAWGGIAGASKSSGSDTFSNTLNAVNHVLVWVDRGRVRYTISQSDPIEIASTPVAPSWSTPPVIASATVGSAVSVSTLGLSGSPTPTLTYSWKVAGVQVATAATYTPVAGDATKALTVDVTGTNASGAAASTSNSVTVSAAATAPGAPTVSNAASITATGLTYTYADPASNGGSAITSRNADISFDGGTTWTAITAPTVGSNTITFASSGSARTAQIRGRATNAVGAGGYGTLTGIAVPAAAAPIIDPTFTQVENATRTGAGAYTLANSNGAYQGARIGASSLAMAGDGVLQIDFTATDSSVSYIAIALDTDNAADTSQNQTLTTSGYAVGLSPTAGAAGFAKVRLDGSDVVSDVPTFPAAITDVKARLVRTGTSLAAERSFNGGTSWVTMHTWTGITGTLYPKVYSQPTGTTGAFVLRGTGIA
jgi:hypothetical protein